MALYGAQNSNLISEVQQLRNQGLSDSVIMDELTRKGYKPEQVNSAIMQTDTEIDDYSQPIDQYSQQEMPLPPERRASSLESDSSPADSGLYERIEEITENLIDEKWDELIVEVKKIIDWKEKVEDVQKKLVNDIEKLKQDFTVLHKGVLGKLEDYDTRMMDVGTELKAVGKVFKDVIPEFVENVKELGHLTGKVKEKK